MGTERPQPPSPAEASNGSAKPSAKEAAGTTKMGFKRTELVRLMIQELHSLGYSESAERLESESGILLQPPAVARFRNGILQGDWALVDTLMPELHVDSEDDLQSIRFLIYQQKYLELLEQRKVQEALQCLRTELATSRPDPKRLHTLTSFIMCGDTADLYKRAHWDGAAGESRRQLLRSLQMFISPTLLLPEDRLEVLLAQAVNQQISTCMYHNTREEMPSLFEDHTCSRDLIPRETRQTLEAHTDEVWFVQFSHDGRHLASASKDTTVIVWEVDLDSPSYEIRQLHTLRGHQEALSFVSWSPDDTMLLSCGNDFAVKLWDTRTGACKRTFSSHTDSVTACSWLPDSRRFVTGGLDQLLVLTDIDGNELRRWTGARINDLAVSHDGKQIVAICSEKKIRLYDLEGPGEDLGLGDRHRGGRLGDVPVPLERLAPPPRQHIQPGGVPDLRGADANVQEIHAWDLKERKLIQKYRGQKRRYVIRSCFGGTGQAFVISGSEDSQVYIWHRQNGALLEALRATPAPSTP
eukprot:tig00021178_g19189.t1